MTERDHRAIRDFYLAYPGDGLESMRAVFAKFVDPGIAELKARIADLEGDGLTECVTDAGSRVEALLREIRDLLLDQRADQADDAFGELKVRIRESREKARHVLGLIAGDDFRRTHGEKLGVTCDLGRDPQEFRVTVTHVGDSTTAGAPASADSVVSAAGVLRDTAADLACAPNAGRDRDWVVSRLLDRADQIEASR